MSPRETSSESAVTHSGCVRPFGGSEKGKNFETKRDSFLVGFHLWIIGFNGFRLFSLNSGDDTNAG